MAVMMMVFLILHDGNHAPMRRFAQRVLELDRRVIDAEVVQKPLLYIAQNPFAH